MARERCLVKFMDNTSSWSSFKELTKLAMPDSDVMCVLCKKSQPKSDDDIIVCDKCGRGYHQKCHEVYAHYILCYKKLACFRTNTILELHFFLLQH